MKDGVLKTVKNRQLALNELVKAIREFRKFTDQPLTLRGSEYAHAVQELNRAMTAFLDEEVVNRGVSSIVFDYS